MAQEIYRPPALLDVLRIPLLGRVLKWRYGRLLFQLPLLTVALLLVYDGFTGSTLASQNLASVVPWIHYRGLVVLALLLVGNLFCMSCPFTLPRTLAKRLSSRGGRFPRILRSKWLAITSLLLLFFIYEWLDLWASPALTAWVIVAYFVAAFVLEAVFSESPFCKYVCPLGTFNFVYSTLSPLQITTRNAEVCRTCVGKECLNGSYSPQPVIMIDQIGGDGQPIASHTNDKHGTLGCGTQLFVPQIKSNMDCVLCLDCVRSCPHDNVALAARVPAAEVLRPDALPKRWDIALLFMCLTFMGVLNAFGMVPPVYDLLQTLAAPLLNLGVSDLLAQGVALLLLFGGGGVLLPALLTAAIARLSKALAQSKLSVREIAATFAPAFVPLGFGIWVAHYSFHFLTGFMTVVPVFQKFLADHGAAVTPDWSLSGVQDMAVIGLVQAVALFGGWVASSYFIQRLALRLYRRQAFAGMLPWMLLTLGLALAALWIFSLPMEMRGVNLFG
ncbi:MAG: FesM [Anaerolineae bacterium]